jgi:glyoxylase-like metal-dependent hydrolase (beta-lactamase superfamily II)
VTSFVEVADRVFVLRYPVLDVNVTLVVGDERALLADTLATSAQAGELVAAVGALTDRPLVLMNTHHHFDHCFGNGMFADAPVYAHPEATALMAVADPAALSREWGLDGLGTTTVRLPDRQVAHQETVDLGGRTVVLRHPGRGHTAGDLVAFVPDAGVVVAGDLIEESGPPQFEDAFPLDWPEAVTAILALDPRVVVPGHGAVCDAAFVRGQHEELAALSWLIREAHADGAPVDEVVRRCGYEFETASVAITRGYAELDNATL